MKKIIITLSMIIGLGMLMGTDFRRNISTTATQEIPKRKCSGYTIIEFGKGIDCNGDTIKLKKVYGGQVQVQQESTIADS